MILLIGLITINKTLDLQLHDTYFAISNLHLGIFFGVILGLLGLGYWVVNKRKGSLLKPLSLIHLIFTIGSVLLLLLFIMLADSKADMEDDYGTYRLINMGISGTGLAFILCQPVYLINLIIGFLKRNS